MGAVIASSLLPALPDCHSRIFADPFVLFFLFITPARFAVHRRGHVWSSFEPAGIHPGVVLVADKTLSIILFFSAIPCYGPCWSLNTLIW